MTTWITWSGGPCPISKAPVFGYEIRNRRGDVERPMLKAGWFGWSHRQDGDDIVAYRLLDMQSAPAAASGG